MKIGIFTDSHYSSQEITNGNRYNSRSLEKIQKAYRAFEDQKCDMVICLGDLIDQEGSHAQEVENLKKVAQVINASPIPTIFVMGNHDAFSFEPKEFYSIVGKSAPADMLIENKNLIFLDACYFNTGAHYMPGDSDWTDCYYPHTAELEQKLANLDCDTYIFLHQNIDPAVLANHRPSNADTIFRMIEACGKVKAVYQGHYHPGKRSEYNGIPYVAFPAMCENEDAYFTIEI